MNKTLALACAALLAACSGDDDDKQQPAPASGNHSFATAATLAVPGTAANALANIEEYDYFKITIPAGVTAINVQTFDQGGTSCDLQNEGVDPFVEVFDASQTQIFADDDSGIAWCEDFTLPVTPGAVYFIAVSGYEPMPFSYVLSVRPQSP